MSFRFTWPKFDEDFVEQAKLQIEGALNGGGLPSTIVGNIRVTDLYLGSQPPDLEMLEIGELAEDKFRAMFKLSYQGDAFLVLHTWIQANPLHGAVDFPASSRMRSRILAADKSLVVPMELRISNLRLRGIAALVVDMTKGVTLCFKNDPLESISVNSTFDNVELISSFLQSQIERQLRKLFVEDMPALIHNLSVYKLQQNASSAYLDVQLIAPDGTPLGPATRTFKPSVSLGPSTWIGGDVLTIRSDKNREDVYSARPMSWNPSVLDRIEDLDGTVVPKPRILRRKSTRWVGNEPWEALYRDRDVDEDLAPQEVTFNKSLSDLVGRKRSGSGRMQGDRILPKSAGVGGQERGMLRLLEPPPFALAVSRWNPQISYLSSFARNPSITTELYQEPDDTSSSIDPEDSASMIGFRAQAPPVGTPKSIASSQTSRMVNGVIPSVASSQTTVDHALEVYHSLPPFVPPPLPKPKIYNATQVDGVKSSLVDDNVVVFLEPTTDPITVTPIGHAAQRFRLLQESQLTLSPYTQICPNVTVRTQEPKWSDEGDSMIRRNMSPVPSVRSLGSSKSLSPLQKPTRTIRRIRMTGKRMEGVGLIPSSSGSLQPPLSPGKSVISSSS